MYVYVCYVAFSVDLKLAVIARMTRLPLRHLQRLGPSFNRMHPSNDVTGSARGITGKPAQLQ